MERLKDLLFLIPLPNSILLPIVDKVVAGNWDGIQKQIGGLTNNKWKERERERVLDREKW